MQTTIFESQTSDLAAQAIRTAINKLIAEEICTADEFISLIDLDQKDEWIKIAQQIAERLEPKIRNGELHPNEVKPWQICPNYRYEFEKIASNRAWRSAHGAINSILTYLSARFQHV